MTTPPRRESAVLLHTAPDGAVKVGVLFRDETAWLTQKALADLFGVGIPAIAEHLKNIFESGELAEDPTVSILETTAADGKSYRTCYDNLDAIIAPGNRVNRCQAAPRERRARGPSRHGARGQSLPEIPQAAHEEGGRMTAPHGPPPSRGRLGVLTSAIGLTLRGAELAFSILLFTTALPA